MGTQNFPGHPLPMPDNPFHEEIPPDTGNAGQVAVLKHKGEWKGLNPPSLRVVSQAAPIILRLAISQFGEGAHTL